MRKVYFAALGAFAISITSVSAQEARVIDEGIDNESTIDQTAAGPNATANIIQNAGSQDNIANINQVGLGEANAELEQSGVSNIANIGQIGSDGSSVSIEQVDSDNLATIDQNNTSGAASTRQIGSSNALLITQIDTSANAGIQQIGSLNSARITQDNFETNTSGTIPFFPARIFQSGSLNSASIFQENFEAPDAAALVVQNGSDHSATVSQGGFTDNVLATVNQTGSGSTVTIRQ